MGCRVKKVITAEVGFRLGADPYRRARRVNASCQQRESMDPES